MSIQPPPAPTASAIGPCPTIIKISRTPRYWQFTQYDRTTQPPQVLVCDWNADEKDVKSHSSIRFIAIKYFNN